MWRTCPHGAFAKMRDVVEAAAGVNLVSEQNFFEHQFVLPSFESWSSPLAKSNRKRKVRSGSRCMKKRKALHEAAVLAESGS